MPAKIQLDPALGYRPCGVCGSVLVRRPLEQPKHWIARKYCGRVCQGAARRADRVARFWARVDIRGPDECWPWNGRRSDRGYGEYGLSDKTWRAHRYALIVSGKDVPDDKIVMHSCDNPPCCNPRHLKVGTNLDNNRDMVAKGRDRQLRGADNPNTKLSETDKRRIIARRGEPLRVVANDYGVARSTICRVQRASI
jgi:hypothetical protein